MPLRRFPNFSVISASRFHAVLSFSAASMHAVGVTAVTIGDGLGGERMSECERTTVESADDRKRIDSELAEVPQSSSTAATRNRNRRNSYWIEPDWRGGARA